MPEPPPRRPTLQQVADRAGVSIATASRALSGSVSSPRSRELVQAAVSDLGYVPNEAARSLRSERTMTVGVAFLSLKLPGALDMLEALSSALDAAGYTLLIADTGGHPSRFDVILNRFLERRVDALICVNPHGVGDVLDGFLKAGVPAVALISRGRGAQMLPLVTPDLREAANEAIACLESLGHRRFLALLPAGERGPFRAVFRRLRASPAETEYQDPFARGFDPAAVVSELVGSPGRPTAVIASHPIALPILVECRKQHIAIPQRLSVIAVSDEPVMLELMDSPLSAIHVDLAELGKAAAEIVLAWLSGNAPQQNTVISAATWCDRATTARAFSPELGSD
ncbi:MAG: LacI family DNA-binding transcriptional regulator [Dehalococcoidia bacterium]